jgi:hypothetical protein
MSARTVMELIKAHLPHLPALSLHLPRALHSQSLTEDGAAYLDESVDFADLEHRQHELEAHWVSGSAGHGLDGRLH